MTPRGTRSPLSPVVAPRQFNARTPVSIKGDPSSTPWSARFSRSLQSLCAELLRPAAVGDGLYDARARALATLDGEPRARHP
eukprot:4215146-Prymnesium_polylepis.1